MEPTFDLQFLSPKLLQLIEEYEALIQEQNSNLGQNKNKKDPNLVALNKKINNIKNTKHSLCIVDPSQEQSVTFAQLLKLREIDNFLSSSQNLFEELEQICCVRDQQVFSQVFKNMYRSILGYCGLKRTIIKLILNSSCYDKNLLEELNKKTRNYCCAPHITILLPNKKDSSTTREIYEEYVSIIYFWASHLSNLSEHKNKKILLEDYIIHTLESNKDKVGEESDSRGINDFVLKELFDALFEFVELRKINYQKPYFNKLHLKSRNNGVELINDNSQIIADYILAIRDW